MKQCFLYLSGMLAYVFIAMPKLNLSITYLFKRPHETRVPVWEAEPTKHYSEKESNKIFYWLFKPLKWFSYEIKIWIMWADRFSLTSYQMLRLTLTRQLWLKSNFKLQIWLQQSRRQRDELVWLWCPVITITVTSDLFHSCEYSAFREVYS